MPQRIELKVLIVEDNLFDAELIVRALKAAGIDADWERVDTETDFQARISADLDLIISDYALPQFSGREALRIVRSRGLDTPFILLSGTIGEDVAVAAIHEGADDYLLKDRLARVGPSVLQAIEKRRLQRENRRFLASLMDSEERFRQITENIREVFWLADAASRELLYVSPGYDLVWGRSREQLGMSSELWLEAVHPDDRDRVKQAARNQHIPGARDLQYRILRPDGSMRWIQDRAFPVRDSSGSIYRVAGVAEDVTEQHQADAKIRGLNRVYAMLSGINNAIARLTDRQELCQEACRIAVEHGRFGIAWIGQFNDERMEIVPVAAAGLDSGSILRRTAIALHAEGAPEEKVVPRAFHECRPVVDNDISASPNPGQRRREAIRRGYHSVIALPLVIEGKPVGTFSLFATEPGFFDEEEIRLLTELAANISFALQSFAERAKVGFLSYYDALTGLPNRALFLDRAQNQIRARGGERLLVALVLLNIERFSHINGSLGRDAGDRLLKLVAQRLESALRGKEHLARIGADNFGILLRGMRDSASVVRVVEQQVLSCFNEPFMLNEADVRVAAKVGIALYPTDGEQADMLFNNAEAALKRARTTGERHLFYAAGMNARAAEQLALETRLRKAVHEKQFVLHYQPKFDLLGGHVSGLEALIRWQDPAQGLVPPGAFIPLLEETGLILEVGNWALRQALADHQTLKRSGLRPPRIAVNVSAIQLRRKDFANMVIDAVQDYGDNPETLELEITESLLMQNVKASIVALSVLRGMGIRIAMDDFGTGYSSLNYIARLPIDVLKIDRSFIGAMNTSDQDMSIVSTIMALAHALDLRVVAEGVEADDQVRSLRALKCDEAQGYFFNKPVAIEAIAAILEHQRDSDPLREPARSVRLPSTGGLDPSSAPREHPR